MKNYLFLVIFLSVFIKFTIENTLFKDKKIKSDGILNKINLSEVEKQIETLKQNIKELHNSKKKGKNKLN
jgi:hypothetical protein